MNAHSTTQQAPVPGQILGKENLDRATMQLCHAKAAHEKTTTLASSVEALKQRLLKTKTAAETTYDEAKNLLDVPLSSLQTIEAIHAATKKVNIKLQDCATDTQKALEEELDLTRKHAGSAVDAVKLAVDSCQKYLDKLPDAIKAKGLPALDELKSVLKSIIRVSASAEDQYNLGVTANQFANSAALKMTAAVEATEKAIQEAKDNLDNYYRPPLSFFLSGRHAPPEIHRKKEPPILLYGSQPDKITWYKGDGSSLSKKEQDGVEVAEILARTDLSDVHLLPCGADKLLVNGADQQKRSYGPLFFIDKENTFYVDTVLAEPAPIADYQGYTSFGSSSSIGKPLPALPPKEYVTSTKPVKDGAPVMRVEIEQLATAKLLHTISQESNWVTMQTTLVAFDSTFVSSNGGVTLTGVGNENSVVSSPPSVAPNALLGKPSGQQPDATVVGRSGLNAAMLKTKR